MIATVMSTTQPAAIRPSAIRPRHAGFVRDVVAIAGRALRAVPRDMTAVVPGALRVTAGSEHETDLFLGVLKEALHA